MSGTVMIFTFVSVIVLHNYMKFEKPVIAVSTSFTTSEFDKTTVDSVKYCDAETLKVGKGLTVVQVLYERKMPPAGGGRGGMMGWTTDSTLR